VTAIAAMVGVTLNRAPMLFPIGPSVKSARPRQSHSRSWLWCWTMSSVELTQMLERFAAVSVRSVLAERDLGAWSSIHPETSAGAVRYRSKEAYWASALARIDPHGPEAVHRRIIRSMNLSTCMLANEQLPCVE
jgi:hypothetical protein